MSAGYILYSLDWNKFRQVFEQPTHSQLTTLAQLLREALEENDGECEAGGPILNSPTDAGSLLPIVARRLALPDWYGDLSTSGKSLWESVVFGACMNCDDLDVGFRVDSDGVYWDVIELAWKQLGVVPTTITEVALSTFGTRPYRYHPPRKPSKSRDEFDREEINRRASLSALGNVLGRFLKGAKRGQNDPAKLMEELEENEGVSPEHKNMIKDLVSDEESADDGADSEEWLPMHSMHTPDEVAKMRTELRSIETAMTGTRKKEIREEYQDELMPAIESVAGEGRMLFVQVDT